MPAKISSDKKKVEEKKSTKPEKQPGKKEKKQVKKENKTVFNPPAIYEKITDKEVPLAPSAWDVFQDFLKGNFAPVEGAEVTPSQDELEPTPKTQKKKKTEEPEAKATPKTDHFKEIPRPNKGLLNVDIIWSGIAIGCLIGAVYFLFGGLQPLVLKNYVANAKENIDEVGAMYVTQVNGLSATQTSIVQNTSYNILADCSEDQKYTNLEEGIAKVEVAERNLFPNQELRTVEDFNGFTETETRETYEEYFDYYTFSLQNLQDTVLEDIRDLPTYANYRNNWIDGCILISKNRANSGQIREYCKDLDVKTEEYLENQKPSFWSEIQEPIEANLSLCQNLRDGKVGDLLAWEVKWLSNYGKITSFVPNIQNNIDRINRATQDMQAESLDYKRELNEIYDRKTSITGIWYLLEF